MPKIVVIHGPNLHLLGRREPDIYGSSSLDEINAVLTEKARAAGTGLEAIQSNSEAEIVDRITRVDYDVLILNPAAYTHTSVAIRDALLGVKIPAIEVHISNIYAREEFRKKSLISDVVTGVITGLGQQSYFLACEAALTLLKKK
ncbi:MAG: type II 3-dehydroquinate dehydratase [Candidatus Omnitrophica bacterium]|nr:type II 3-dehydroquinate dehydratase [Candidatus Omnitrophota bacterium]